MVSIEGEVKNKLDHLNGLDNIVQKRYILQQCSILY